MNSRNSARTNIFAGILDIHVHNVTGVPGIINVGEHDIFVRFLFGQMDSVSDVILQTKVIRKGGGRPNFDQSLQIGIPLFEKVLKCELVSIRQRGREEVIGMTQISLDELMEVKQESLRRPREFQLTGKGSTDSVGAITLTLAFHKRSAPKNDLKPPKFMQGLCRDESSKTVALLRAACQNSTFKQPLAEEIQSPMTLPLFDRDKSVDSEMGLSERIDGKAFGTSEPFRREIDFLGCGENLMRGGDQNIEREAQDYMGPSSTYPPFERRDKSPKFHVFLEPAVTSGPSDLPAPIESSFPSQNFEEIDENCQKTVEIPQKRAAEEFQELLACRGSAFKPYCCPFTRKFPCNDSVNRFKAMFSGFSVGREENSQPGGSQNFFPFFPLFKEHPTSSILKRRKMEEVASIRTSEHFPSFGENIAPNSEEGSSIEILRPEISFSDGPSGQETLLEKIRKCATANTPQPCTNFPSLNPKAKGRREDSEKKASKNSTCQSVDPHLKRDPNSDAQISGLIPNLRDETQSNFDLAKALGLGLDLNKKQEAEKFPTFSKIPSLQKLFGTPKSREKNKEISHTLQNPSPAYQSLQGMPPENRDKFTQMIIQQVENAKAMEGSKDGAQGSMETCTDEVHSTSESMKEYKKFCERLEMERKLNPSKVVRYGSHAFF